MAVSAALAVLGYLEMPEEDSPPEEMWHHDDRLTEWFEAVKERRQDRSRGMEPISDETASMTSNEHTKEILGG